MHFIDTPRVCLTPVLWADFTNKPTTTVSTWFVDLNICFEICLSQIIAVTDEAGVTLEA